MKRRTFRKLLADRQPKQHHSVYVVLLNPAVGKLRKVRAENPRRDPKKPCVYVGMTGLPPEDRFANHKNGVKAAYVVMRYGVRLLPELFAHLNPMPFEAAAPDVDEFALDGETAQARAGRLAIAKARALAAVHTNASFTLLNVCPSITI